MVSASRLESVPLPLSLPPCGSPRASGMIYRVTGDAANETRRPGEDFFDRGRCQGHRVGYRQRESRINQLLAAESKILWCPQVEGNARARARFSNFPQRTPKSWTGWRMTQSDANCSRRQPVNRLTLERRLTRGG